MAAAAQLNDVRFNRIPVEVKQRWRLVRDVVSGDQALRTGEYLPTLNAHDQSQANLARNAAYRTRAVWYPATQFTLEGFIGLAFRNDPTAEGLEKQTKLRDMLENVDGAGVSLYQQSQSTLANILQVARHGLLVDWSEAENRAVIKSYASESIINWRYSMVQGKAILTLVVLEEDVEVEDGPWAIKHVKQWREIFIDEDELVYCRLWREQPGATSAVATTDGRTAQAAGVMVIPQEDANGVEQEKLLIRSRGKPFTDIPFVFIGANSNDGARIDPSPLYGLASLNLAHFRNSADFEDSVFFCGQVQPYITGLDTEWRDHLENPKDEQGRPTGTVLYVGSRTPILLPTGADFGYAQAQPNSLVKEAMDQKEAQMIAVGARMIEASAGGSRTATEDENDKEATTSVLSMCVSNVNEAYQRAIWFAAQWADMGEDFDAADAYKIKQEFVRAAANPQIVDALVKMWQTGVIAKADVREYMRKIGLIATERGDQEIEDDITKDGPTLGMLGAAAALAGGQPGQPGARVPKPGTGATPPAPGQQTPPQKK